MLNVWGFADYKSYLKAWSMAQPHRGHGSKAALARAAQCQTAYISQVLRGAAHLSLEQGERIAAFLGLGEDEQLYFLLLLQKDRAGTESLRRIFQKQIQALAKKNSQLKSRIEPGQALALEAQATYFSSWIYAAVHLLARLPEFQGVDALARRLGLPPTTIEETRTFLESVGLLRREQARWTAGEARMHLPHDSPLISRHHIGWRLRAIRALEMRRDENLHYSSAVTISKKDALFLREMLLKTIESAKQVIKGSEDEVFYSLNLDFFEV